MKFSCDAACFLLLMGLLLSTQSVTLAASEPDDDKAAPAQAVQLTNNGGQLAPVATLSRHEIGQLACQLPERANPAHFTAELLLVDGRDRLVSRRYLPVSALSLFSLRNWLIATSATEEVTLLITVYEGQGDRLPSSGQTPDMAGHRQAISRYEITLQ